MAVGPAMPTRTESIRSVISLERIGKRGVA